MGPRTDVAAWIARRDGIAHTSTAKADGFSDHAIRAAIGDGRVRRVRRSWLVSPECDERRVAAATAGGRVTCVTVAALRGLWTPQHDGVHVAVPASASRVSQAGLTVHWGRGPVPASPASVDDHPLNALFHVSRCLTRPDALAVWESALRTGLVDGAILERVEWRGDAARELAQIASELSDSGIETRFIALMRTAGVAVRQQAWIDGHRVDGLIGERLIIQIDGFAHHSSPRDRRRDIEADARLVLRGYTVLRFDYVQVLFESESVVDAVLTAIAQGLHRAR